MRILRWLGVAILFTGLVVATSCRVNSQGPDPEIAARVLATTFPPGSPYSPKGMNGLTLYVIDVVIAPTLDRFSASQEVLYTHRGAQPVDHLIFHVFPNATFLTEGGKPNVSVSEAKVEGRKVEFTLSGTLLRLPLSRRVPPGGQVRVALNFTGVIPRLPLQSDLLAVGLEQLFEWIGGGGKASGNFGIYGLSGEMLSLGHWYPVIPRMRGDDYDTEEPSGIGDVADFEVANYQVDVTVPPSVSVVTSGVKVSATQNRDSKTIRYHGGAMRDFAIACSPKYQVDSRQWENVTMHSHFLPEHKEGGAKALEYATRALQYYDRAFGRYPYPELDVVEAPLRSGAGGMEYPAMVTISHLFYSGDLIGSSVPWLAQLLQEARDAGINQMLDEMLEFIVAHEVAHQWWHALVGNDSKGNPFIDEALANYSTILYFEDIHGKEAAQRQMYLQMELNYQMARLMGCRDTLVDQPVTGFKNNFEYAAIVYGKGALYFHTLRNEIGKETLLTMLRNYAQQNRFRITTPADLQQAIEETLTTSGSRFTPAQSRLLAQRWLRETHGDDDIGRLDFGKFVSMFLPPDFLNTPEGKQIQAMIKTLGPFLIATLTRNNNPNGNAPLQLPDMQQLFRLLEQIGRDQ